MLDLQTRDLSANHEIAQKQEEIHQDHTQRENERDQQLLPVYP